MTDTAEPTTATVATHHPTDAAGGELVGSYHRDGYVVLPDALSVAEVRALREEAVRICRGELGAVAGVQPPEADAPDEVVVRRYLCIHFPYKLSERMRAMLAHRVIVDALTQLIGPNIKAMQSMLFIKSEGKPGQAWHQDELFIPTRDRSLTAAWMALDDATGDNGCLWVLPGSHRPGCLYPDRDEDAVPVEVPAGSVVLCNGYLLHMALPNTGRHGLRRALVNHYMRAESLLPWMLPPAGVTMGRADHRDIVMVAGTDPYAYKGTVDVMRPHVRPDGQGGCLR